MDRRHNTSFSRNHAPPGSGRPAMGRTGHLPGPLSDPAILYAGPAIGANNNPALTNVGPTMGARGDPAILYARLASGAMNDPPVINARLAVGATSDPPVNNARSAMGAPGVENARTIQIGRHVVCIVANASQLSDAAQDAPSAFSPPFVFPPPSVGQSGPLASGWLGPPSGMAGHSPGSVGMPAPPNSPVSPETVDPQYRAMALPQTSPTPHAGMLSELSRARNQRLSQQNQNLNVNLRRREVLSIRNANVAPNLGSSSSQAANGRSSQPQHSRVPAVDGALREVLYLHGPFVPPAHAQLHAAQNELAFYSDLVTHLNTRLVDIERQRDAYQHALDGLRERVTALEAECAMLRASLLMFHHPM
ncbi:MAG: hypothetical protein M1816_005405 [Peltula sp. TS41687]|nr:MAG: hypothetical protein M1816_005405 [Peltula sp. TS41687]